MLAARSDSSGKDHSACSGCSLCLLVCPVWRQTRDITMTPHGRSKALQNGVGVKEFAESIDSCTLCMACEPVCPENIALTPLLLGMRRKLVALEPSRLADVPAKKRAHSATAESSPTRLLLDSTITSNVALLARMRALLGGYNIVALCGDDGADIALALECGAEIPAARLADFLALLRTARTIIVGDGLLLRHLREWLPNVRVKSLGEALSALSTVRNALRKDDLYVIEARAFHSDYERLVKHYSALRFERGCAFNLDLQRIAIPATVRSLGQRLGKVAIDDDAQARWLLQGRKFARIVVESLEEGAALARVTDVPVVHVADIAGAEMQHQNGAA